MMMNVHDVVHTLHTLTDTQHTTHSTTNTRTHTHTHTRTHTHTHTHLTANGLCIFIIVWAWSRRNIQPYLEMTSYEHKSPNVKNVCTNSNNNPNYKYKSYLYDAMCIAIAGITFLHPNWDEPPQVESSRKRCSFDLWSNPDPRKGTNKSFADHILTMLGS